MLEVELTAAIRTKFGKGASRTLRRDGLTPAVLYGPKIGTPKALQLDTKIFTKSLLGVRRRNAIYSLEIAGDAKLHVILKETQTNPIYDTLVHADFYEIDLNTPMVRQVPLKYVGKAKGVDLGGELQLSLHKVTLKAKPLDIPDEVEIDLSQLGIEDTITCKDLALPANVEIVGGADTLCATVVKGREEVVAVVDDGKKKGKKK